MAPSNRKSGATAQAGTECSRGAAVGALNGLILAAIAGATPATGLLATLAAGAVGALIGLLLYSSSVEVAEERVLPPRDDR